jgi:Kdo2-lipid IVA lauroyltransferase/acyltransferase
MENRAREIGCSYCPEYPMTNRPPDKSNKWRPTWTRRLRWFFERILGNFVYWLARHISRKAALKLADFLGEILFLAFRRYRLVCMDGIGIAFGDKYTEKERYELARSSQKNLVRTVMDFLRFGIYTKDEILGLARSATGMEYMRDAIEKSPGGVICLAAHLGSWEYCGAWLVASGLRLTAVGKEQRDPGITKIMLDQREAAGIKHISRSKKGLTAIIRSLRTKGTALGLIADQNGGWDGIFVDFFGVPASSARGPAFLALKYNAPVVPMFAIWDGDMYRVEILPEVEITRTGDLERDILENTQRIQNVIEDMVRKYPGQWLWAHRQ